jgi:hypothetical protein
MTDAHEFVPHYTAQELQSILCWLDDRKVYSNVGGNHFFLGSFMGTLQLAELVLATEFKLTWGDLITASRSAKLKPDRRPAG